MPTDENNQVFDELKKLRTEIKDLKIKLSDINSEKEMWFSKKDTLSKSISQAIGQIKNIKSERDSATAQVKEHKESRNALNKEAKEKIETIKKLRDDLETVKEKTGIKEHPSKLHSMIRRLENTLETNVMSFEKEKKLLAEIKALKKQYQEYSKVNDITRQIRDLSRSVDHIKKDAQNAHNIIQNEAKESQSKHENLITNSKTIDELKKEEEEAFSKFIEYKKQFNELNAQLKDKISRVRELGGQADNIKEEKKAIKQKNDQDKLKSKEEIVREKMKKGEKLTTDDILVLQAIYKEEDRLAKQ